MSQVCLSRFARSVLIKIPGLKKIAAKWWQCSLIDSQMLVFLWTSWHLCNPREQYLWQTKIYLKVLSLPPLTVRGQNLELWSHLPGELYIYSALFLFGLSASSHSFQVQAMEEVPPTFSSSQFVDFESVYFAKLKSSGFTNYCTIFILYIDFNRS